MFAANAAMKNERISTYSKLSGFTDGEDFLVTDNFVPNPAGGPQHQKDAVLTIDMAKENPRQTAI